MEEIKLISHNALSSIDSIKMAALYFDKIEISTYYNWYYLPELSKQKSESYIMAKNQFSEPTFFDHIQPLVSEKIVRVGMELAVEQIEESTAIINSLKTKTYIHKNHDISQALLGSFEKFYKQGSTYRKLKKFEDGSKAMEFGGEEVEEIRKLLLDLGIPNDKSRFWFIYSYFGRLMNTALESIDKGENLLTTSEVLDDFLKIYLTSSSFNQIRRKIRLKTSVNPKIAFDAISLNIPTISKLSMEDILELRLKLYDELKAFKTHLARLQFDLEAQFDQEFISIRSKEIVDAKITPALDDLANKLNGLHKTIPITLLKELKDPKSYSPLILTMTNNISSSYAILVSLGLISLSAALEQFKSEKEIKKNGLYYLLKLKRL